MNWMEVLQQLFEIVIFPLLGVGTVYLVSLIKTKIQQIKQNKEDSLLNKYLTMLEETITSCVIATTQTYVESLKKENAFDANAQKVAFTKTYTNVMKILSEDARLYLETAIGDLETYVYTKIESQVNLTK